VTTPDDRVIDSFLIDYVLASVPNAAGEHFNLYVSTGLAPRTYLDKLVAEPLVPFTFAPAGAAVYQPGQFATAATRPTAEVLKVLDAGNLGRFFTQQVIDPSFRPLLVSLSSRGNLCALIGACIAWATCSAALRACRSCALAPKTLRSMLVDKHSSSLLIAP
jgi:hypothetical protein